MMTTEKHCNVYGECGGCALTQSEDYNDLKLAPLHKALAFHEIETEIKPLILAHGVGRRRATFHKRGEKFGFSKAKSHEIINIDSCPVLSPALQKIIPLIKQFALFLHHSEIDVSVLDTNEGVDLNISFKKILNTKERELCLKFMPHFPRIRINGELISQNITPTITIDDIKVNVPPLSFLQATKAGEIALQNEVLAGLKKEKRVLDLFCGLGTFTLPLLKRVAVHAVEWEQASLSALQQVFLMPQGLKPLTTERRDLYRLPVSAREMRDYDCVVIDPPRAGAEKQFKQIALSPIKKVISVSCNVETFARDAKILIDAGFKLNSLTPIDQFKFSNHLEVVGVFQK